MEITASLEFGTPNNKVGNLFIETLRKNQKLI